MTRDIDAIAMKKWAETGDVETPEDAGLNRAEGWPSSYSQAGGKTVSRTVMNQMFRELTALGAEINARGILPWDSRVIYDAMAHVVGSDGLLYKATKANENNNPTEDDGTNWTQVHDLKPQREILNTITAAGLTPNGDDLTQLKQAVELIAKAQIPQQAGDASETSKGVVELATQEEAEAGEDDSKVMTPLKVKQSIAENIDARTQIAASVNIDGTDTAGIRSAYNVDSITDLGTGRYRVNLSSGAVSGSNYSMTATASSGTVSGGSGVGGVFVVGYNTSSTSGALSQKNENGFEILVVNNNSDVVFDSHHVEVQVTRTEA